MHSRFDLSFPIEHFQHLPNPYPHDAARDAFLRTNIVNLDLASPTPPRFHPKNHPLTPPDTPSNRKKTVDFEQETEHKVTQLAYLETFLSAGLVVDVKGRPTRYLVVGGVPNDASATTLSRVFCRMGELKGMFVRFQATKRIVVLSWHDIRDAKKAYTLIRDSLFFGQSQPLSAAFISPQNLIKATGPSPFVNENEGDLCISAKLPNSSSESQPVNLHAALALFGELSAFSANYNVETATFFASYYDARDAANASKSLHGRSILGMSLQVMEDQSTASAVTQQRAQPSTDPNHSSVSLQKTSHDTSFSDPPPTPPKDSTLNMIPISPPSTISPNHSPVALHPVLYQSPNPRLLPKREPGSNRVKKPLFSSTSVSNLKSRGSMHQGSSLNLQQQQQRTLPPRLSMPWLNSGKQHNQFQGLSHRNNNHKGNYRPSQSPHQKVTQFAYFPPLPSNSPSPDSTYGTASLPPHSADPSTVDSGPPTPPHHQAYVHSPGLLSKRGSFDHLSQPGSANLSRRGSWDRLDEHGLSSEKRGAVIVQSMESVGTRPAGAGATAGAYQATAAITTPGNERNSVEIGRIEAGLDTRTTVMLKNVPNKMSDVDLQKYISDVVPNSYDFMYLRFDFHSSANVGYAFVNFVDVADLLKFAKAKLGVKWNLFCSEKVLQMSYANFQGKEALVEKFKNSCVMEMQDEWVPKIFYSSGPKKGQREPFPPASNPSRARRSQDQRDRGLIRNINSYSLGRPLTIRAPH
ncbi:hypothetical protein FRB91_007759 [Serendipita sp. 411]|nr:hypothetical protein FRB91_007759 [Serendipita sp. 411]